MDISIIVVPYKCKDALDVTLNAVYNSVTTLNYEVIIVDNNSEDGSAEMVKDKYLSKPEIAHKTQLLPENTKLGISKSQ